MTQNQGKLVWDLWGKQHGFEAEEVKNPTLQAVRKLEWKRGRYGQLKQQVQVDTLSVLHKRSSALSSAQSCMKCPRAPSNAPRSTNGYFRVIRVF